jgi:hypothetical protein
MRVWLGLGAGCGVALLLLHCGEDEPGSSPAVPDAANVVIDSGSGNADANGAPGDAATIDADAGPPVPPPQCTFDELHKFIRILPDGGKTMESWEQQSLAYIPDAPWRIINSINGGGREYFRGIGAGEAPRPTNGSRLFDFGFARTAMDAAVPNNVFCWGKGGAAEKQMDGPLTLPTQTGKVLGQCPGGTAITGEVTLCTEGNFGCNAPVQGALNGVTLTGNSFRISGDAVDPGFFGVNGLGLSLVVFGYTPTQPASGETKPLTGVFAVLPTPTNPGGIYCMGDGSEVRWATATGSFIVLKNVTKLGDCGGTASPTGAGTDTFYLCRY